MGYHLTVGGEPWCNWTGCVAGQRIAKETGVFVCGCDTKREAAKRAAALATHFDPASVKIVRGRCPEDLKARLEIGRDYVIRNSAGPARRLIGFVKVEGVLNARLLGATGGIVDTDELGQLRLAPRGEGVDFVKQAHDAGVLWMARYSIGGASGSNAFGTYAEGYAWLVEQAARLVVVIPEDAIPSTPDGQYLGWSYEAANGARFGIRKR